MTHSFAAVCFYVASSLFAATFLLGVLVQLRLVDSSGFRWLHHALFFLVFASAAVACVAGFAAGQVYALALAPVLVLYIFLPRVRAGTPAHAALAGCALVFYVVGYVLLS